MSALTLFFADEGGNPHYSRASDHSFTNVGNQKRSARQLHVHRLPSKRAPRERQRSSQDSIVPSASQEREIYNAGGVGFEMSWRVPQEKLDVSQWNTKSEPPLSAAQAVTKARSYLASHGKPSQLPVAWLQLLPVNDALPTCFIYVLQFGELWSEPSKGSLIVMLLDGSVVACSYEITSYRRREKLISGAHRLGRRCSGCTRSTKRGKKSLPSIFTCAKRRISPVLFERK